MLTNNVKQKNGTKELNFQQIPTHLPKTAQYFTSFCFKSSLENSKSQNFNNMFSVKLPITIIQKCFLKYWRINYNDYKNT